MNDCLVAYIESDVIKKSYNDFKIWKIIESNCKILCISKFFFFFVISIYSSSLLFYIFYNLCFLLTSLKNNPRATTVHNNLNFEKKYDNLSCMV